MSPAQILVENSLYDISQIPIASDNVDAEALLKPKHWDMKLIFNFMIFFGSLSALYTIILFLIMIFGFHAAQPLFQTAWFIEALTTEMVVVILVRTVRVPFFRSLPSLALFFGIVVVTGLGLYLPYSLLANSLNFVAPPMSFFGVLAILLASYAVIIETAKYNFFKKFSL
jgi:Mg2+-importing ATPase